MNWSRLLDMRLSISVMVLGIGLLILIPVGVRIGALGNGDEGKIERSDSPPPKYSEATVQSLDDAPPTPPPELALVDKQGMLVSPQWDDRRLPPSEKAGNPIVNPRWEPFARCMERGGVDVRSAPSEAFTQDDLDSLVARLNVNGPLVTSEDGRFHVHHSAETRAFASCAASALYVVSEDLYKILTPDELRRAQSDGFAAVDSPPAEGH